MQAVDKGHETILRHCPSPGVSGLVSSPSSMLSSALPPPSLLFVFTVRTQGTLLPGYWHEIAEESRKYLWSCPVFTVLPDPLLTFLHSILGAGSLPSTMFQGCFVLFLLLFFNLCFMASGTEQEF